MIEIIKVKKDDRKMTKRIVKENRNDTEVIIHLHTLDEEAIKITDKNNGKRYARFVKHIACIAAHWYM